MLWIACALFVALWLWVAVTAGAEIPEQYDMSGAVTRWDSKWSFLIPIGGVGVALGVAFSVARLLIPRVPGYAINLPSRAACEYWADPHNRDEFDRKVSEDLEWLGGCTVLLLACVLAASGTASGDPVSAWVLVVPTVLFLVGVVGFCARMIWGPRYRVPH